MTDARALAVAWAEALGAWAIPQPILDAAPASPYGFPAELFVHRAERAVDPARPSTPTTVRALEPLAALDGGGDVLDVGAGGGATSRPLLERCGHLIAVDGQQDMLDALARLVPPGVELTTIAGRWPDVADATPACDVAVCGHVAYNAPDLEPFLLALTSHARRRVVLELTDRHPLSWMNDLWLRFHGVVRPQVPSADDAEALCAALGARVHRAERLDPEDVAGSGFARREDAIALIRRRLCLLPERDDEIADALGPRITERDGLWHAGPREQRVVTLWWDTPGA